MVRYGTQPRAVSVSLWGIPLPLNEEWDGKCVYVWFEAVQGYTRAQIWSEEFAKDLHPDGVDSEELGHVSEDGKRLGTYTFGQG